MIIKIDIPGAAGGYVDTLAPFLQKVVDTLVLNMHKDVDNAAQSAIASVSSFREEVGELEELLQWDKGAIDPQRIKHEAIDVACTSYLITKNADIIALISWSEHEEKKDG